jgi:hypothetical protein
LIQRAASDGIEIMRRVDQSPASVLGVATRGEPVAAEWVELARVL